MNYRVTWLPSALGALASIWTTAQNRRAITDAANRLDRLLTSTPFELGESRETISVRLVGEGPLQVFFEIREPENLVVVYRVTKSPR